MKRTRATTKADAAKAWKRRVRKLTTRRGPAFTHRRVDYRAKDGWRWRIEAANGNIVAESGEAYRRKPVMLRSVYRLCAAFRNSTIEHHA